MLKLKLQHVDHLMRRADSLEKDPDAGRDGKQKGKAAAEDYMVGWHHRLNGHELEQTLGDGLDGLATGLALIAVVGMAGALFLSRNPQTTLFYFALMGGLLAFLFYNYNPASVFLGDSGSMFIGFVISVSRKPFTRLRLIFFFITLLPPVF